MGEVGALGAVSRELTKHTVKAVAARVLIIHSSRGHGGQRMGVDKKVKG